MTQLIKIHDYKGKRAVSARELHFYLETEDYFSQWAKRMFEYGFIENVDYQAVHEFVKHSNGVGGTNKIDYALSIDTAKEIAMIQRTPKGKQARQYFIQMEQVAIDKSLKERAIAKGQFGGIEHESAIVAKKAELMNVIKYHLRRGDLRKIAVELNMSYDNIKNASSSANANISERVLNAMYKRAMQNKNELLFSYQEMIDMLKN